MSGLAITNRMFLETAFVDALPGTHTVICSFRGDPSTVGRESWAGRPWSPGQSLPRWFDRGNTYFTVSAFEPDPQTGELRRRKANFVQMVVAMVDDVGTKVSTERLMLPPSVLVETSTANYQAMYLLINDEDSRDRATCERLLTRMVAAGLAVDNRDPGMKGVTRFARLPVGINGKAKYVERLGGPFAVRCTQFNPDRRYRIAEIAAAWRLDMTPDRPRAPVIPISAAQARHASGSFGALVEALEIMGMYRGRIGSGPWHDVQCPWVHEHSDAADNGAAIADPGEENNYAGGFKCFHGHGDWLGMRDVWAWVRALRDELERAEA